MKNLMILVALLVLTFSCNEKEPLLIKQVDLSEPLCESLITFDETEVTIAIAKLVDDLPPVPVASDAIGQKKNLKVLVSRLDDIGCLKATLDCYACLESFPPLSIIQLEITGDGNESFLRDLYLRTSAEEKLSFNALHEL